jgi:hypothetical protein
MKPRRDDEPLGWVGCLFALIVLAMGLAAFEAALKPHWFAP